MVWLTELHTRGWNDELVPLDTTEDGEENAQLGLERLRSAGAAAAAPAVAPAAAAEEADDGAYVCRVSGGVRFATLAEYKAHCRSDWYRFNLRRRARGQPPLTEDAFDALVDSGADLDEISGSDESDDDDEAAAAALRAERQPIVSFRHAPSGLLVSVWRCILAPPPRAAPAPLAPLAALGESARAAATGGHWLVLLSRGGHFAAIVARLVPSKAVGARTELGSGAPAKPAAALVVLAHRCLHRYVTRRKAGGRQSTADGAKTIKSVGSSLRRHNETMLTQEIRETLAGWRADWLDSAAFVFFAAPGPANSAALFGGANAPLSRADPRVRSIPFITNRPTLSEASRAVTRLAYVDVHAAAPAAEPAPPPKPRAERAAAPRPSPPPQQPSAAAAPAAEAMHFPSELHAAAAVGDADAVAALLESGYDPTLRHPDFRFKVPYDCAENADVRNAFRRRMAADPDGVDWKAAKVPSALTDELEASKAERDKARERERRKRREREKREAKASAAAEASALRAELAAACAASDADALEALVARAAALELDVAAAQDRVLALRAEQLAFADPQARRRREAAARAAAIEQRLGLAAADGGGAAVAPVAAGPPDARCDWCGKPLPAQSLSRHAFRYCSTACVHAHGKQL